MADAIQSFLESYRPSETDDASCIPHPRAACCCGNEGCAYLRQNTSALEAVERDVRTAAQLGQVCLGVNERGVESLRESRSSCLATTCKRMHHSFACGRHRLDGDAFGAVGRGNESADVLTAGAHPTA